MLLAGSFKMKTLSLDVQILRFGSKDKVVTLTINGNFISHKGILSKTVYTSTRHKVKMVHLQFNKLYIIELKSDCFIIKYNVNVPSAVEWFRYHFSRNNKKNILSEKVGYCGTSCFPLLINSLFLYMMEYFTLKDSNCLWRL